MKPRSGLAKSSFDTAYVILLLRATGAGVKVWLGGRVAVDNATVGVLDTNVGIVVVVSGGNGIIVDSRILLDPGVDVAP